MTCRRCGGSLKRRGAAGSAGRVRYKCSRCGRSDWGRGRGLPLEPEEPLDETKYNWRAHALLRGEEE